MSSKVNKNKHKPAPKEARANIINKKELTQINVLNLSTPFAIAQHFEIMPNSMGLALLKD